MTFIVLRCCGECRSLLTPTQSPLTILAGELRSGVRGDGNGNFPRHPCTSLECAPNCLNCMLLSPIRREIPIDKQNTQVGFSFPLLEFLLFLNSGQFPDGKVILRLAKGISGFMTVKKFSGTRGLAAVELFL